MGIRFVAFRLIVAVLNAILTFYISSWVDTEYYVNFVIFNVAVGTVSLFIQELYLDNFRSIDKSFSLVLGVIASILVLFLGVFHGLLFYVTVSGYLQYSKFLHLGRFKHIFTFDFCSILATYLYILIGEKSSEMVYTRWIVFMLLYSLKYTQEALNSPQFIRFNYSKIKRTNFNTLSVNLLISFIWYFDIVTLKTLHFNTKSIFNLERSRFFTGFIPQKISVALTSLILSEKFSIKEDKFLRYVLGFILTIIFSVVLTIYGMNYLTKLFVLPNILGVVSFAQEGLLLMVIFSLVYFIKPVVLFFKHTWSLKKSLQGLIIYMLPVFYVYELGLLPALMISNIAIIAFIIWELRRT